MLPLKVTCHLAGDIAREVPKLDGLIERAVAHRCDPAALGRCDGDGNYGPGGVPSPIFRQMVAGCAFPIPACSWPIFSAVSDRHEYVHKRFSPPMEWLSPNGRSVFYTNSGELRGLRMPLRVRTVNKVVWFCVGNRKEIKRLLTHPRSGVRYLGAKPSIGYGAVAEWIIEEADDDYSWFAASPAGTVLMRGLPASAKLPADLVGYRTWFGGVAAPYWNARYHREMVDPC